MPETTGGPPQLLLAFDYGLRRIGVASGDTLSCSATALCAVPADHSGPRWNLIDALMCEWQPSVLVVGVPYHADGSENAMSGAARAFATALAQRYELPVNLIDERYSSLEAGARLKQARATGLRKRRVAKADVDATAACVIMERWLNENHQGAHAVTTG